MGAAAVQRRSCVTATTPAYPAASTIPGFTLQSQVMRSLRQKRHTFATGGLACLGVCGRHSDVNDATDFDC